MLDLKSLVQFVHRPSDADTEEVSATLQLKFIHYLSAEIKHQDPNAQTRARERPLSEIKYNLYSDVVHELQRISFLALRQSDPYTFREEIYKELAALIKRIE